MIDIRDIDFRYPSGDYHLFIEDLAIARGEKVAVIGPSGSGKTTLLNLAGGILTPGRGRIKIGDFQISSHSDRARRDFRIANIGFIFQDFGLIDYLQARDNILHPYRISRALKTNADVRGKARRLAQQMGIGSKLDRYPADLSHGERQRVAICRALLPGPKLILADEATGNLDPKNKLHIIELLFENVDRHDATLLAVTHDHELLHHFDRIIDFRDFLEGATG